MGRGATASRPYIITQTKNPPIKVGFFIRQGSDNVALDTTPCPRVTVPTCPPN